MKRSIKGWLKAEFDSSNSHNKRLRLDENSAAISSKQIAKCGAHSVNFLKELAPQSVSDLAVHQKKIKEVEEWLRNCVIVPKPEAQFLLITGPTGCGKTTTVNVLCKSLNVNVSEWVNPIDRDFESEGSFGQVDRLTTFISDSKYASLLSNDYDRKKVVLIEDYPNAVVHDPGKFGPVLETCSAMGRTAVIFICTENNNDKFSLSQSLFPPEVRSQFNIHHISFNECSATMLKNALKRAQNLIRKHPELYKMPTQSIFDAVVSSAMGDIRCTMNQYYFACLKGTDDIPLSTIANTRSSRAKKANSKDGKAVLKSMSRDEVLGFFHGLGRVFNPKRVNDEGTQRLRCDLEQLLDELGSQPMTTSNFLFENYIKYFGCLEDVYRTAEVLSLTRVFLERWNDGGEIALWTAVLAVMVYNRHGVSKWTQITGPPKAVKNVETNLEGRSLSSTDYFYHNYITKTSKYHNFVCKVPPFNTCKQKMF